MSKSGFKSISFHLFNFHMYYNKIDLLDNSSVVSLSHFPFQSCSFSISYQRNADLSSILNLSHCCAQYCKSLWRREWGRDKFKVLVLAVFFNQETISTTPNSSYSDKHFQCIFLFMFSNYSPKFVKHLYCLDQLFTTNTFNNNYYYLLLWCTTNFYSNTSFQKETYNS